MNFLFWCLVLHFISDAMLAASRGEMMLALMHFLCAPAIYVGWPRKDES